MDVDKVKTTNVFPTNIITYTWPDIENFNKQLTDMVIEQSKITPSVQYSNVGGYHSPADLLTWDYPCLQEFISMIQAMSQIMAQNDRLKSEAKIDLSLAGWSNIMENGDYHMPHRHPNNFWSGCYYIAHGDPDESVKLNGYFEMQDPRAGANMLTSESLDFPRYQVKPSPGLMIMFPSYLEHLVHPYIGDSQRITIAFNVRIIQ